MNAYAAAALDNAKARLVIGWPLLVLAVAAYAPAEAVTRLVLTAAAVTAMVRALPERTTKPRTRKVPAAGTRPKAPAPKKKPNSPTTSSKIPAQRTADKGARP